MKSSTGELLDRREGKAQQEHTGYTGALELYDELINFLGLAGVKRPTASPQPEVVSNTPVEPDAPSSATQLIDLAMELGLPIDQPVAATNQETHPVMALTASGALNQPVHSGPLAQPMQSGALAQSKSSGALIPSAPSGPLMQSAPGGPLTQAAHSGSPVHSLPGGSLTQSTHSGALTQSMPEDTPAPSVAGSLPAQSDDIIRVTGSLAGFLTERNLISATVTCGECGHSSNSGEMFCIHCGGLLEEAAVPAEVAIALAGFCEDCGAAVESDEIFCPSCGSVMTAD
jgi:hypothetical protein